MKVPKGTAPEDFWPQMNMLSTKKSVKTTPGNMSAVFSVTMRCSPPLNVLYRRDETYPAMTPQKTKQSIIAVLVRRSQVRAVTQQLSQKNHRRRVIRGGHQRRSSN